MTSINDSSHPLNCTRSIPNRDELLVVQPFAL
jgi:hypothetical protein